MANKQTTKPGEVVSEDEKRGIIYVVHPVSPARKKELMKSGKKIIDAKFKPVE